MAKYLHYTMPGSSIYSQTERTNDENEIPSPGILKDQTVACSLQVFIRAICSPPGGKPSDKSPDASGRHGLVTMILTLANNNCWVASDGGGNNLRLIDSRMLHIAISTVTSNLCSIAELVQLQSVLEPHFKGMVEDDFRHLPIWKGFGRADLVFRQVTG